MSYVGTAGTTSSISQVYRNARATRKRRAAPQLPSELVTEVMSYVPEGCAYITNNSERCGASFKYRNQLNQQPMDCSHYCIQNVAVWLSSLLQDLAEKEYISFLIPSLNRTYQDEYIVHPITLRVNTSAVRPRQYIHKIELDLETTAKEIEEYVGDLQQAVRGLASTFVITIPVQIASEYEYENENEIISDEEKQEQEESLYSLIGSYHSVPVELTDSLSTTSILRHFHWSGEFYSYSGSLFYLQGYLDIPLQ